MYVLTRGPIHLTATHDVDMKVVDRLSSIGTVVDDHSIAFHQLQIVCYLLYRPQEVPQDLHCVCVCVRVIDLFVSFLALFTLL